MGVYFLLGLALFFVFLAGVANAMMDTVENQSYFKRSIFELRENENVYYKDKSQKWKWAEGDTTKERFLFSSSMLVWMTDFWHFAQELMLIFFSFSFIFTLLSGVQLDFLTGLGLLLAWRILFSAGFRLAYFNILPKNGFILLQDIVIGVVVAPFEAMHKAIFPDAWNYNTARDANIPSRSSKLIEDEIKLSGFIAIVFWVLWVSASIFLPILTLKLIPNFTGLLLADESGLFTTLGTVVLFFFYGTVAVVSKMYYAKVFSWILRKVIG